MFDWERPGPRTIQSVADSAFESLVLEDMDASKWSERQGIEALVWAFTRAQKLAALPEYLHNKVPAPAFVEAMSRTLAACTLVNVPPRAYLVCIAETLGDYLNHRNIRLHPGMLHSPKSTARYDEWASNLHHKHRNLSTFSTLYVAGSQAYRDAIDAVRNFMRDGKVHELKRHDARMVMHALAGVFGPTRTRPPDDIDGMVEMRERVRRGQAVRELAPVVNGRPVRIRPKTYEPGTETPVIPKPLKWDPRESEAIRRLSAESAQQETRASERSDRMDARRSRTNTHKK